MNALPGSWKRRVWTVIKWGLIVTACVLAVNWGGAWWVASSNQRRIDAFFESVGARSLKEFVGAEAVEDTVSGNAWYLYLGALACMSEESEKAATAVEGGDAEVTESMRAVWERDLDRAHRLIEIAAAAPRNLAELRYDDPLDMRLPQTMPSLRFVKLAADSAHHHAERGEPDKAASRLDDGWRVTENILDQPSMLSYIVHVASRHETFLGLAAVLQKLPASTLSRFVRRLDGIDPDTRFRRALAGEVFFGLAAWEAVATADRKALEWLGMPTVLRWGYPAFVAELDKAAYLDRMVPVALDPSTQNVGRIDRESTPFYAVLTAMCVPILGKIFEDHLDGKAEIAVMKEALRLETARRREGRLPDPRASVDGIAIRVERSETAVTLGAVIHDRAGRKPLVVVLEKS